MRILHVDDEADIREIVQIALSLDRQFVVCSCASGEDALARAADWKPDLILCDVMMPVMDGPATLASLRENPATATIPIIFMTARAQEKELRRLISLGAIATIAKPFDPMSLAQLVRHHLTASKLEAASDDFDKRLQVDRAQLVAMGLDLSSATPFAVMEALQNCAHKLAGAAGIFGRQAVSDAASRLEDVVIKERSAPGQPKLLKSCLETSYK